MCVVTVPKFLLATTVCYNGCRHEQGIKWLIVTQRLAAELKVCQSHSNVRVMSDILTLFGCSQITSGVWLWDHNYHILSFLNQYWSYFVQRAELLCSVSYRTSGNTDHRYSEASAYFKLDASVYPSLLDWRRPLRRAVNFYDHKSNIKSWRLRFEMRDSLFTCNNLFLPPVCIYVFSLVLSTPFTVSVILPLKSQCSHR